MEINWKFFQFAAWKNEGNGAGFWFRLFGHGLSFKNGPMNFSERYEYEKPFRIGSWRIKKIGGEGVFKNPLCQVCEKRAAHGHAIAVPLPISKRQQCEGVMPTGDKLIRICCECNQRKQFFDPGTQKIVPPICQKVKLNPPKTNG